MLADDISPYGDHPGDGLLILKFTLPSDNSNAALELARESRLEDPEIIHKQVLTGRHTYYVVVGRSSVKLFEDLIDPEVDPQHMTKDRIEELAASLGRQVIVVGATTGTDTHTVGLDAMLNLKGWDGHKGLEAYGCFEVHNLGSQVSNEELVAAARRLRADVVLVSQTVTQQDLHIGNLRRLKRMIEDEEVSFVAVGGPRITNEVARDLGFDAGFGRGTLPEHVGTAIVRAMLERRIDLVHANKIG